MRYDLVVVVMSIVGGSEKVFTWDGKISKTTTECPYDNSNTILLLRHLYDLTWMRGT